MFDLEVLSKKQKLKVRQFSGKVYFTYDDIKDLGKYPDSPLLEILDGDLFVVPLPTIIHQEISKKLTIIIDKYLQKSKTGICIIHQ